MNVFKFDPARDATLIPQIVELLARSGHDRDIAVEKHAILVAEIGGEVVGIFSLLLMPVVDTLEVKEGTLSRYAAQSLTDYAKGYILASGFKEAMFTIREDNMNMRGFVQANGGRLEGVYATYTAEVR